MIYLDNAATTYPKPRVVYDTMDYYVRNYGVNVSRGSYNLASEASNMLYECKSRFANIFKIDKCKKIIFTPSATISINTILKGFKWEKRDNIYYSPFEHNAVLRTLYYLEDKYGLNIIQLPVDKITYEYDLEETRKMFEKRPPKMVNVAQVSNVCGLVAPVEKLAILTHEYGGSILVDAAQAAGHISINLNEIDYYVWSGHKSLYGPFGIAGFFIDNKAPNINPFIHGGTGTVSDLKSMPDEIPVKYEAGSYNIHAISGLNAALKWIEELGVEKIYRHEKKLSVALIDVLNSFYDINLYIPKNLENHIGVVSASFSNYLPHDIGKILNEQFDIAVRTGLHCAPLAHEFLGSSPQGLVRFSVGYFNTEDEINNLEKALESFII